jgi:hypothetical protein
MAKQHAYSALGLGLMFGGCLATVVAAATLSDLSDRERESDISSETTLASAADAAGVARR